MTVAKVEAGPDGPALTDDDALLAALRHLWPILSPAGRQTAIDEAERVKAAGERHPVDQSERILRRAASRKARQ